MPFLLNSNASYVLWLSLYQIVVADFCSPIQNSQALFNFLLFYLPPENLAQKYRTRCALNFELDRLFEVGK